LRGTLEDQINNVRDLVTYNSGTDTTADAKHRVWNSFGEPSSDSASGVSEIFGVNGTYRDPVTGFDSHRERWAIPWLGQWITKDPIGFEGGDTNLHRMVDNSPINSLDPTGTKHVAVNVSVSVSDITLTVIDKKTKKAMDPPGEITLAEKTELKEAQGDHQYPSGQGHDLTAYMGNSVEVKADVTIQNNDKCPVSISTEMFFAQRQGKELKRTKGDEHVAVINPGKMATQYLEKTWTIEVSSFPSDGKYSFYTFVSIRAEDNSLNSGDYTFFEEIAEPWYVKEQDIPKKK
jgi:RHS repeat-associated protein